MLASIPFLATVGSSQQIFNNAEEPVSNELTSTDCVVEAFAGGINHTDHLGLNVPVKKAEGSSTKKRGSVFKQARTLGKSFAQQKNKVTPNGKAALKKNEEVTLKKNKVSPAVKKCNNNRSSGSEIEQSPSPVSISQVRTYN